MPGMPMPWGCRAGVPQAAPPAAPVRCPQVFLREAKRTRLDPGSGGFVTDNEWVLDTEGEAAGRAG